MDIVNRALVFATIAHAEVGQFRKYTGEPYIVHPIEVMMLVRNYGGSDAMQAAALMHDVIEDCRRDLIDITEHFGDEIAELVWALTDREEGNRAQRKAAARDRLAASGSQVQTIKLADLISNSRTILAHDPGFAKVYLAEKVDLLRVLTKGDRALLSMAWDAVPAEFR